MSRFFRSGDSSSSSEDEEDDDEIQDLSEPKAPSVDGSDDIDALANASALSVALPSQTAASSRNQQWTSHHKDVLLHALLEDWCLNETVKTHGSATRDDPEIQAEARAKYLRLVSQLAPLDVLPAGLGADQHANTRQRYRDVLGVFDRQNADAPVSLGARRLLTDGSTDAARLRQQQALAQLQPGAMHNEFALQAPLRRLLGHGEQQIGSHGLLQQAAPSPYGGVMPSAMSPAYGQTRYHSDFEELSILGRGGYGIVYHVRNRLDNQAYAVKKVPLSAARLQRIRARGQVEVEDILLELRTLARLHHPNIVRYFNAWVEWADGSATKGTDASMFSGDDIETQDSASLCAQDIGFTAARRVFTEDEVDGDDIVFEHSTNDTSPHMDDEDPSGSVTSHHSDHDHNHLQRTRTRSTLATTSSDDIESIERDPVSNPDVSVSIHSTAEGANFAQPTLAIHIQMSLHPMTLADLLRGDESSALRHCFHLEPAVGIASAVLDGLEYLHEEGVVHRDIKPANIFLSPARGRGAKKRSCVDSRRCGDCDGGVNGGGGELDVCIGDFGLATMARPEEEEGDETSGPVGTAIYRPRVNTNEERRGSTGRTLDIFALGIVFFELLWRFETRMERQFTLCEVKEGRFPEGFCERVGKGRGVGVLECVDCMLARDGDGDGGVGEVRGKLEALVKDNG